MRKILSLLTLFAVVALPAMLTSANAAFAAATDWATTDNTRLRLISQTQAVGTDAQVTLGLHFELNDHWKIYWRSPGDAGYPPSVVSEGSTNVAETRIDWPLPERFSILGFETLATPTKRCCRWSSPWTTLARP